MFRFNSQNLGGTIDGIGLGLIVAQTVTALGGSIAYWEYTLIAFALIVIGGAISRRDQSGNATNSSISPK